MLSVDPAARLDILDAANYYEAATSGLGGKFVREVLNTFDQIESYPWAWPAFQSGTRRCLVRHFPFGVIYMVDADAIHVVAVMHLRRGPGSLDDRIR